MCTVAIGTTGAVVSQIINQEPKKKSFIEKLSGILSEHWLKALVVGALTFATPLVIKKCRQGKSGALLITPKKYQPGVDTSTAKK